MQPVRITSLENHNQLLYFTSSSILAGDDGIVYIGERKGQPNLFYTDLHTGKERQLTFNNDGSLKSYVYFWGNEYRGFGKASVSLHPESGNVYYIQGMNICCVDIMGNHRILAKLPDNQMTAFTHVSSDGTRLCVPTTDARALYYDTPQDTTTYSPNYNIDKRIQDENLNSYIRVYDTTTGEEVLTERVPKSWITHVQFSPADNNMILYNHEWPAADWGIRRMWIWDGQKHIRLREEGGERNREDIAVHEMWQRDGRDIIYHGIYKDQRPFIGKVKADGTDIVEIPLPETFTRYGHFTVSNSGLMVSDGYYRDDNDPDDPDAQWISIQSVDWDNRNIRWIPVCKCKWASNNQDSHPHPIFNHSDTAVYYTSSIEGNRAIYKADVSFL